jgi:hypothetical protein
MNEIFDKVHV